MDTPTKVTKNQKGMVLIYVAILLTLVFGLLGLVVDSGHLFKVRTELQNAADAAALKGAYFLFTMPTDPTVRPVLQWDVARDQAEQMITENRSDNTVLKDAVVEVGYWNMSSHTLQPTTLAAPTTMDVPAVRVVTSRSAGSNGGPVPNYFMQLFNAAKSAVGSRPAVAVKGAPNAIRGLFPMALSKCMVDDYFFNPEHPQQDPPPQIKIYGPYGPGGTNCYSGQWTSFKTEKNSSSIIEEFMYKGYPDTVATGDDIWIEPGAKADLYSPKLTDWLPEGGKDVIMAVVDTHPEGTSDLLASKGELEVTGFATFHIDGAVGGNDRYVYGHFIGFSTTPPGAVAGGIPPGGTPTLTMPLLVQ